MALIVRRLTDETHDMTFGRGMSDMATTDEAVAQNVTCRLLSFRGNWFLDTQHGLPYFQTILGKPVKVSDVAIEIKSAILQTPDVASIETFDIILDPTDRVLTAVATIKNVFGTTIHVRPVSLPVTGLNLS